MSEAKNENIKLDSDGSPEIAFTASQNAMFNGFSENLYGNNWFVLTTNDGGKSTSICGILDKIPTLSFRTETAEGPQKSLTDLLQNTFTGRGSIANALGGAVGANLNVQLSGNYTKKVYTAKDFQSDGFELTFDAWKRPLELFDPSCPPSSQKAVIDYLTKYATVETVDKFTNLIDRSVDQAMTGLGSIVPIGKKALEDGGRIMFGGSEKEKEESSFLDTIEDFANAVTTVADEVLVRGWNDKQRMTYGRTKFNEPLHRLDVLRAGVLDTYFIVGVENWSYELDQNTLGEKMNFTIKCKIDQRMNSSRLHLYSDRKIFK